MTLKLVEKPAEKENQLLKAVDAYRDALLKSDAMIKDGQTFAKDFDEATAAEFDTGEALVIALLRYYRNHSMVGKVMEEMCKAIKEL